MLAPSSFQSDTRPSSLVEAIADISFGCHRTSHTLCCLDERPPPMRVRWRMLNSTSTSPPWSVSWLVLMMDSPSCPPVTSRFPSGDWLTARSGSCEMRHSTFWRCACSEYVGFSSSSGPSSAKLPPPSAGIPSMAGCGIGF